LSRQMKPAAKKRLGQHFLRDTGVLDRIARLIKPSARDLIIEVGAGDGALSTRLAASAFRLFAVEVDEDCMASLTAALAPFPAATVVRHDILSLDARQLISNSLLREHRLRYAGNLPFNISTRIIEKLLRSEPPAADMTFMVQLEVAERITSPPGSKQYGYFSVVCQHLSEVHLAFRVSPACFVPRPKVVSAVVTIRPISIRRDPVLESHFVSLTKAAFGHRRKTLANSLKQHAEIGPYSAKLLAEAGIDGELRAEELSASDFEKLAQTYQGLQQLGRG